MPAFNTNGIKSAPTRERNRNIDMYSMHRVLGIDGEIVAGGMKLDRRTGGSDEVRDKGGSKGGVRGEVRGAGKDKRQKRGKTGEKRW